jgi:RNA polymerase sigma factor (sigma-70 family)
MGRRNMLAAAECTASLPYSGAPARAMVMASHRMTGSRRRMAIAEPQKLSADEMRRSALMAAAQAGDKTAYETLLRDCVPLIRAIARRQGVAGDRVDDVVQEVLLTVHRARQTYDPSRSFTAWLRVIAERRAVDLLRQTGRRGARELHAPIAFENFPDASADPAVGLKHADDAGRVSQALASLPARQREAVQYLVLEEQSLAEASALTRRSKVSLKVNLHRALKALRGSMEREG